MSKTKTNKITTVTINGVNYELSQEQLNAIALLCGISNNESSTPKKSATPKNQKKSPKKSAPAKKQTYEEHLEETFGSKADRTKFVEVRELVASEFRELGKEFGYMPKKIYKKQLNEMTNLIIDEGFNKTLTKKHKAIIKDRFLPLVSNK